MIRISPASRPEAVDDEAGLDTAHALLGQHGQARRREIDLLTAVAGDDVEARARRGAVDDADEEQMRPVDHIG